VLAAVLAVAALAAGVTGAWSPCGFSMVDTLAPHGYADRVRTTVLACATFTLGALAGGVITFGGLSLLGAALGAGAPVVAGAVALAAAIGEARRTRIVPQVRRQVPEPWRRVLPLPLAAGLYGVLLGLGFTTFILTFAVWALAGVAVALGDPGLGLAVGLAFGAGRALPLVALAPSGGGRAAEAMAQRPAILRGLRRLDAAALAACALALWTSPAQAATVIAAGATDPSVDEATLALDVPPATGLLIRHGVGRPAPGRHPAVGGGHLAWIGDGAIQIDRLPPIPAPGADAVAVSAGWVAWRAAGVLWAAPIGGPARPVASGAVGRPALNGATLLYDLAERWIVAVNLVTGGTRTLRRLAGGQLRQPSAYRGVLLYVRGTFRRQQLVAGPSARSDAKRDRVLYSTVPTGQRDSGHEPGHAHDPGHNGTLWAQAKPGVHYTLWTTALSARAAYVTSLRQLAGQPVQAAVLRVRL
jgi:hypothetical protein